MKKSLVILSTALAVFASTSCNGNNPPVRPNPPAPPVTPSVKVTEVEWNEAIENIVNHKKQNYLNYVAKGDLAITEVDGSYEETEHIYLIEMNGDCGHANELISSDTIYDTFSLKKGHTYLEVYKHDDVVGGDINEEPLYGFFDEVLDLYGNMSAFTYEKDRYIVKPEEAITPLGKTYLEVSFNNDKKISQLVFDYDIKEEDEGVKMKGVLNFAYGNSTVTTESFPNGWKDVEKNLFVNLTEANNYEVTFENKYTVVINIEIGNTLPISQILQGTREDQIPYYPFKDDDDNLYVYKNNVLLKRGTESEKEGYYLTGKSERYNSYEELNFTDKFKSGDKFEIYVKHCDTSGNGTMKFI